MRSVAYLEAVTGAPKVTLTRSMATSSVDADGTMIPCTQPQWHEELGTM